MRWYQVFCFRLANSDDDNDEIKLKVSRIGGNKSLWIINISSRSSAVIGFTFNSQHMQRTELRDSE